jgi:hypothetical protein
LDVLEGVRRSASLTAEYAHVVVLGNEGENGMERQIGDEVSAFATGWRLWVSGTHRYAEITI